jgi:hypothetical protein
MATQLSEREIADLVALADGTLPAGRRAEVESWVAADPELVELVERQRRSLAATKALADERMPAWLFESVRAGRRRAAGRARPRRLALAFSAAGALVAIVVAVLVLALGGAHAAPTVADAAHLAFLSPSGPAPAPLDASGTKLALSVGSVSFPDFSRSFGWRAVGVRKGTIKGRGATVVYYASGDRRIAYAIVSGAALPRPSDAQATSVGGVEYQTLSLDGHLVVTWRRAGHTCVLTGSASPHEMLALASWRGSGTVHY